jgi:hypothetical protein
VQAQNPQGESQSALSHIGFEDFSAFRSASLQVGGKAHNSITEALDGLRHADHAVPLSLCSLSLSLSLSRSLSLFLSARPRVVCNLYKPLSHTLATTQRAVQTCFRLACPRRRRAKRENSPPPLAAPAVTLTALCSLSALPNSRTLARVFTRCHSLQTHSLVFTVPLFRLAARWGWV